MTRSRSADDASEPREDADFLISESALASQADAVLDVGAEVRAGEAPPEATDPAPPEPDADTFLIGAEAVRAFIAREWKRQLDYRLKKEVWTYSGDQVSILFEYEWHDAEAGEWISTFGEEHWQIGPDGLLRRLSANGRDIVIDDVAP